MSFMLIHSGRNWSVCITHKAWLFLPLTQCVQLMCLSCCRSNYPLKFPLLLSWVWHLLLVLWSLSCGVLFWRAVGVALDSDCSGTLHWHVCSEVSVVLTDWRQDSAPLLACVPTCLNHKYSPVFLWAPVLSLDWAISIPVLSLELTISISVLNVGWAISVRLYTVNTELEWLQFPEPKAGIRNQFSDADKELKPVQRPVLCQHSLSHFLGTCISNITKWW